MSAIFLSASRELHQAELTCRAEVSNLTGHVQDSTRLNVKCRSESWDQELLLSCPDGPVVTLVTPLQLDNVREGHDVYFSCQVEANPSPGPVSWIYNVRLLLL